MPIQLRLIPRDRSCRRCGKLLPAYPIEGRHGRPRILCSEACYGFDKICAFCGTAFVAQEQRRKFCSKKCNGLESHASREQFEAIRHNNGTPEERFWHSINRDGPVPGHIPELGACWIWTGCGNPTGYGRIVINRKPVFTHRFSWQLHFGPIPAGLYVCHRCDTPACARPDHLFLGTQLDNARDCTSKGRWRGSAGEANGQAVLTVEQVRAIRHRYATERTSYARLGREYGVSGSVIAKAITRQTWLTA